MLRVATNYKPIPDNYNSVTELIINKDLMNDCDLNFVKFMDLNTTTKILNIVSRFEKTIKSLIVLANSDTYKLDIYDLDQMVLFIRFGLRVSDMKLNRETPRLYLDNIISDLSEFKDIYGKAMAISYDKNSLIFGLNISELYKLFNQSDYSTTDLINNSKFKIFEAPYIFYKFNKFWCYNPVFEDLYPYVSDIEYIRTIEKLAFPDLIREDESKKRRRKNKKGVTK